MRFNTTLFLLILVAGLIAFVITYERNLPGTKLSQAQAIKPFDFKLEAVDHIEVTSKEKSVKLELKDGQWEVLRPYQDRGNPELIASILQAILDTECIEKLRKKDLKSKDYRRTGLSGNNNVGLILKQKDQTLAHLSVGSNASLEESAFLSIAGNENEFYLVKTKLNELLPSDLELWRDPQLTRFKAEEIKAFSLSSGNGIMEFAREQGKPWQIIKPLQTRGSNERINAILTALLKLEVHVKGKVEPKDLPITSAMLPEMKIQLDFFGKDKPQTLSMRPSGDNSGTIQVEITTRTGSFDADPKAASYWKLQPNHLRDQNLAHLDSEKMVSIKIETPRYGKIEMEREGHNWLLNRHGDKKPARTSLISNMLSQLQREQIADFVSDTGLNVEDFGLHQPFLELELKDTEKTQILKFGSNSKGGTFAKYKDEPFIYQIDPKIFEAIPGDPAKWQSLKVIDANLFTARRIILAEGAKPVLTLFYKPEVGDWTATMADQDITDKLDPAKANELLQKLVGYEVHEWVTTRSAAYEALKNPTLTLQLLNSSLDNPSAEPTAITLRFAPLSPGNHTALYYGQVEGELDPFYITKAAYEDLLKLPLKQN